ncbi:MAG TPA: TrkA family potassium uptake protein [Candidatus Caenarcaniphilales bacterium]|nr:TrkA family potassium uptake protein [Candidatus Caenarcaniphilales bacterium]
MRVIVVGCGRVGAGLSEQLARGGHDVTVIDLNTDAFNRLEPDFPGQAIRADGTDEDVLRRVGTEGADMFFALTEGDNRNVLAAQLAIETFGVRRVVAKINDPVRAEAYTALGVATICRTRLMVDALGRHAGLETDPGAGGVRAPIMEHSHGRPDEEPALSAGRRGER